MWYLGSSSISNSVGILVDRKLREQVVKVRRVTNKMMVIKIALGRINLHY